MSWCSGCNCGFNLMNNDAKHLFISLFASYIYSSAEYVFMIFNYILFGSFDFLMLRFKSSSYILGNSCLLNMWFENIFAKSIPCIFILPIIILIFLPFLRGDFVKFFSATIYMFIWFSSLTFGILNYLDYCWILNQASFQE